MKTRKTISIILLAFFTIVLTNNCSDDEGVTYSVQDVSSRVTGFGSTVTGAGAYLTINGSRMDEVLRVFIGTAGVPARLFTEVTESGITFQVPLSVVLGMQEVLVVYGGNARAFSSIEVIPFQAVQSFVPYSAVDGETITITGANLDIVTSVKIGTITATILNKSVNTLQFTVPTGVSSNPITLISEAGSTNSANSLISCTSNPTAADCADGLNLNDGFELGTDDNFDNWGKWNGGAYMFQTTAPTEVFRGDRALKVVRDGTLSSGQWRLQLASDLVTTEIGASYTVYIWAKASSNGGSMRVSTNPNALYTADQNVTTEWQRLPFTFGSMNEASTRVVLDMNGNNTVATTFYIDDVKLIKN